MKNILRKESKRKKRLFLGKAIFIGTLFLFANQNLLYSQTFEDEYRLNKEFLLNFKSDFRDILVSFSKWDRRDFVKLSAVFSSGIFLYAFDQKLYDWIQDQRTTLSKDLSKYVSKLGNGAFISGFIAALYASGEFSDNRSLRKTALLSLESWLTSGVVVLGMKFLFGRARPQSGESSHSFCPFSSRANHTSFPSGDAASAFAVATTISQQSEEISIDILSYSLATLVAIYRVHDQKHWVSDVFIGSSIGYFIAKKISALNRNQNLEKLRLSLQLSRESQTLSFTISF